MSARRLGVHDGGAGGTGEVKRDSLVDAVNLAQAPHGDGAAFRIFGAFVALLAGRIRL
jgi:hypothetical protein